MENKLVDPKKHWEEIYQNKPSDQLSWTQETPETSLAFFEKLSIPKSASIIDVGGGNSKLVDYLLELGYHKITVLDISSAALERTKKRLGDKAKNVNWIVGDITQIELKESFDVWHDRAAFHFLTEADQIEAYQKQIEKVQPSYLVMGTFSTSGPEKCSGLSIQQYDEKSLAHIFLPHYLKISCEQTNHQTPFNTPQNFLFCGFKRG